MSSTSSGNATASTSRVPPAPAPTPPSLPPLPAYKVPVQVAYDLSIARDASTASDASWQDATESSLEWILSLSLPPTDKGKEKEVKVVHWYCGAEGAEECWESAVFLVRLLSFKRQGEIATWRDQFDQ